MPSLFPQKYYSTAHPQSQTNVRKFSNFSDKRHKVRYAQTAAQLARGRTSRYAQTAAQLARGCVGMRTACGCVRNRLGHNGKL